MNPQLVRIAELMLRLGMTDIVVDHEDGIIEFTCRDTRYTYQRNEEALFELWKHTPIKENNGLKKLLISDTPDNWERFWADPDIITKRPDLFSAE